MSDKIFGKIIIPYRVEPKPREIAVAQFFNKLGKDIEFLLPNRSQGIKTPDIKMDGIFWEVKSPTGNSKYTLQHCFKDGLKQSQNIIFDLRYSQIYEKNAINQLKRLFEYSKTAKRMLIITKQYQLLQNLKHILDY